MVGGSLESLDYPYSLESLESGHFRTDPFSKKHPFPIPIVNGGEDSSGLPSHP